MVAATRSGCGEAHALERGQGLRIVLDAGEHQAAEPRRQLLLALEQRAVAAVHALEDLADHGVEAAQRAVPPEGRHLLAVGVGLRKLVGLVVGDHLGPVLQRAQVAIGLDQIVAVLGRDVAGVRQGRQGVQGARAAQVRMAAAQDQLLGLDEELDLADAAAPQLQVRALGGQAVVHLVGVDLALDRMDVGDGREVEVLAPDERLQLGQERLAAREVAGAIRALMCAARSQFWPTLS
jgi:hypothetical protein